MALFPVSVLVIINPRNDPITVKTRMMANNRRESFIFMFPYFLYVMDETAEASTSDASDTPTASNTGRPKTPVSRGVMNTAADNPANPVLTPAPIPARIHISIVLSIVDDLY